MNYRTPTVGKRPTVKAPWWVWAATAASCAVIVTTMQVLAVLAR